MIKLTDLIKEEEPSPSPEEQGFILRKKGEKELFQKGYMLGPEEVDPETGAITTKIINLPKFDKLRKDILTIRKEIQPFKFSSNPDIAKVSKDTVTQLTKINNLIFALDRMIELYKKQ